MYIWSPYDPSDGSAHLERNFVHSERNFITSRVAHSSTSGHQLNPIYQFVPVLLFPKLSRVPTLKELFDELFHYITSANWTLVRAGEM